MRPALAAGLFAAIAAHAAAAPPPSAAAPLPSPAELAVAAADVKAAEIAFARTLADRRLDRFADFVAEDAVFNGSRAHVGKAAVLAAWKGFFDGPRAPFSWAPDAVAASADGRQAISTGLARDPSGRVVSRFTSLWRKEADGHWRVAVDQGVDAGCAQ